MNKLLFFFFITILFFFSVPSVIAQNKAGINIGTKYGDLDQAISTVGPGGWIVVIAGGTGDCNSLQGMLNKTNAGSINLIVRGHLGNQLSPADAKAWTATLGQLSTDKKIYFMPWNEPNQDGSADSASPTTVAAYTNALLANLGSAGLRGNKVFVLSPMINQSHPNFSSYIGQLGGGGYFSQFDGIAMNLYDFGEESCGSPLCNPDGRFNPSRYPQVLQIMGASGKPAFGVESGTAGNNFYWKQPPGSNSPLYRFVQKFLPVAPEMFAIPSYDLAGEAGHSWSLFSPADTANLLSSSPKGSASTASFNKASFNSWLDPLIKSDEFISCGSCGFAPKNNPGLCQGTGSGPGTVYTPKEGCDLNNPGTASDQKTSRPVPYEKCNETENMTSACTTSFTITDEVQYRRKEGNFCPYEGGKQMVEKSWSGTVVVDPQGVSIPFAGKKGEENEQKYLADYFEGTGYYYKTPYDLSKKEDIERAFKESGVFRKLAPANLQDNLKKAMIFRAQESKAGRLKQEVIRDYLVSYNSESARLTEFANHLPPAQGIENYDAKYEEWKVSDGGKWFRLWPAVPMFSREDTVGEILPYLGSRPLDTFEVKDQKTTIDRVPHLARLFEVTRAINQLLLPAAQNAAGTSAEKSRTIVAAAQENPAGQKVLLAQACQNCPVPQIVNPSVSGGLLHYTLQICHSCSGYGTIGDVYMGPCGNPSQVHSVSPKCFSSDSPAIAPPVPISCPGSATACVTVRANRDVDSSCQGQPVSASCTVTVDANCQIVSTTCGAAPPPPPTCGLKEPNPVDKCERTAISGPGDALCCSPVEMNLKATDQFENKNHESCDYDPITGILLNPSCMDTETQDVSRKVGVALSHPYLSQIYNYTADSVKGFFNIFRPAQAVPEFAPTDALSQTTIKYKYNSASGKGDLTPTEGDFYFPYLGGIQKAKEFVINILNSKGGTSLITPPSSANLGFGVKVNDTNVAVSPDTKKRVIENVKLAWPKTKIETKWDYVYNQAKANGYNPAFVIALWIEESGASGKDAYDFGCLAAEKNNLDSGLNCLFNKIDYKDKDFEYFMCMFSEGKPSPCTFATNPNFPGNLKYWYEELIK